METPGFEPGTLRMRSGCDTTTPHSLHTEETVPSIPCDFFGASLRADEGSQQFFDHMQIRAGLFRELNPGPLAP